ncbi:PREDICTED: clathrin light chain 2-like isoform X2 [Populus euphratica]|uniref:Clathrin light chain n=1 Tax=Populus euphratica TaxID=75702 RepID=A0AAJ6TRQ2_POPEU|nr:PREDICTED: clathrin light chain 2-like isoform X2 [Populus euphratica]
MSTFSDSFAQSESTRPFDDDDSYAGYNSQPFDDSFATGDDVFESQPPIHGQFSPQGKGEFGGSEGQISLSPSETEAEQGPALIEWRRQNAILLEDKERREKEVLSQIIKEAEDYKVEFYKKRQFTCESNKTTNREKEKLFLANQEKFHAEADKNYWKSIAELIPNEVPAIERRKGKKDQDKKPAIVVIQGPKPGKPTELSRMRQILLKLKHDTPPHLKHSPAAAASTANAAKTCDATGVTTSIKANTVVTAPEPVAVA